MAAVAIVLAAVGVLFASASPDGIERLLSGNGRNLFTSPLADYEIRIFESELLRKSSAGLAGLAVIYAVCFAISRMLSRRRSA